MVSLAALPPLPTMPLLSPKALPSAAEVGEAPPPPGELVAFPSDVLCGPLIPLVREPLGLGMVTLELLEAAGWDDVLEGISTEYQQLHTYPVLEYTRALWMQFLLRPMFSRVTAYCMVGSRGVKYRSVGCVSHELKLVRRYSPPWCGGTGVTEMLYAPLDGPEEPHSSTKDVPAGTVNVAFEVTDSEQMLGESVAVSC